MAGVNNQVKYTVSLTDLVSGKLQNIEGSAKRVESSLGSLQNSLGRIGQAVGIAFGVQQIKDFAMSIIDAGTKVEDATTGLTTFLGSKEKAVDVVNTAMKDAMETPFNFETLLKANQSLISTGMTADKAREDVLNLGNAIAATGGGNDEFQRMIYNMQQIANLGKASSLDIKQFGYANINIYRMLKEAHISVQKGAKDDAITYDDIAIALKKAHEAGGIYYNGLENMAGNTSIQVSNLGDQFFQLKNQMFQDLKPAITHIIQGLSKLITNLKDGWQWCVKNKDAFMSLGKGISFAFNLMAAPIKFTIKYTKEFIDIMGILYKKSEPFRAFIDGMVNGFNQVIDVIKSAVGWIIDLGAKIGNFFENLAFWKKSQSGSNLYDTEASFESRKAWSGLQQSMTPQMMFQDKNEFQDTFSLNPNAKSKSLKRSKDLSGLPPKSSGDTKSKSSPKGASGTKSITINISINKLIESFKVSTTTINESLGKVKEAVVSSIMSAVNQSELIADI